MRFTADEAIAFLNDGIPLTPALFPG